MSAPTELPSGATQTAHAVSGAAPIAVVMVSRNCLPALKRTVESLRALNDARIRPIFVDGASTDGTAEYVLSMAGWAWHAISEADNGIYAAMNKGWSAAPANAYVLYLGGGDLLLELPQPTSLRHDGAAVAVALGDCLVGDMPFQSRWGLEMRLRNTSHHQAMLVLKSVWPDPPFDESLRIYGDWDFNLRLMKRGIAARYVPAFRTLALAGGVSWRHELPEIRQVATRHSGACLGAASYLLNGISRWRRDRKRDSHATSQ